MDIHLPLPAALRQRVQYETHLWAHIVSIIISPPLVWTLWTLAVTVPPASDRGAALLFAGLFAFSVCILPMCFVAYMVRIGKIGDMHMRQSNERYIPYSIAIGAGALNLLIALYFDASPVIVLVTLVSIIELSIILLGTFFSHISLHAMALSSVVAATAIVYGVGAAFVYVPLLLLVILARLVLKRHTPIQIMQGTVIGLLTPLAVIAAVGLL
ncbi:MAG: hypothetical protein OXE95_00320 [Chloroflexi bacterium]|nr:hypothetical protein [Chloroflexota bacterium]MCY4245999.1 hypothetical protein [Chloroflexota bacterium]